MYLMQLYTESVDVYSFGILLWQLITCEKPFDGYTSEQLVKEVGDIIYYTDHFVLPLNNYNPFFSHTTTGDTWRIEASIN
jgi:serine/threonine protein kinase